MWDRLTLWKERDKPKKTNNSHLQQLLYISKFERHLVNIGCVVPHFRSFIPKYLLIMSLMLSFKSKLSS